MKNFQANVCLSLGSNLGNREEHLIQAIALLKEHFGINIAGLSGVYESAPLQLQNQPRFLNCVVALKTALEPAALLQVCQGVEKRLGRIKKIRFGPRVIDLDILFYDQRVIRRLDLQIPHPRLHERRFVLEPLYEINPNWEHPVLKKSVQKLLVELGDEQKVRYIKNFGSL